MLVVEVRLMAGGKLMNDLKPTNSKHKVVPGETADSRVGEGNM